MNIISEIKLSIQYIPMEIVQTSSEHVWVFLFF
jgi:hypothetical protein